MMAGNTSKVIGLIIGTLILIACVFASIVFGATDTGWQEAIEAYTNFNGSNEHLIILTVRVPRALIALAVGASLAVAGALMQALTRNPLASPEIFGVNAGASFFIVVSVLLLTITSLSQFIWIGFLGAAIGAAAVYILGTIGREGTSSVKIVLAGAAVTALFSAFTQGILTLSESTLDEILFWLAGSVAGRKLEMLLSVLPYMLIGLFLALLIARPVNTLAMGEDVATGLGQRTAYVKLAAAVIIVLLAGSSVALAGSIGFVGIVVPHIARYFVGIDYRWVIPYSALLGAILLLLADIGARFVVMPEEAPIGIMTALVGTPFFVYIARRGFAAS
ncbi:iron ABC transporter permease [Brevibacillus humidisoli]|nr:iron ABC transporter permease [Brevibacillus humidisoli]UFJ43197.1 iron ABC transporter permease [Brevibacillus humidisoli]